MTYNVFSGTLNPTHSLTHVYYGQMAGWIRIPLSTDICLGPGDIVLDGDPASPPRKGTQQSPTSRPTALSDISAVPHFTHNLYC